MRRALPLLRKMRTGTAGSVAVEFALVAAAVVSLMFGMIEAGRLIQAKSSLDFALDRAARLVLRDVNVPSSEVLDALKDGFKRVGADEVSLQISDASSGGTSFVKLEATYQHDFIVPVMPAGSVQLTSTRYVPS